MKTYVTDTHTIAWFLTKSSKISRKADDILSSCQKGNSQIYIPIIVMSELSHISKIKRINIGINIIINIIQNSNGFIIVPFDYPIFKISLDFPDDFEIHDRIIAATAKYYKVPIITKDSKLLNSPSIETLW